MQARDLMTSPTIACHPNETLNVVAQRMWEFDIGALLVVNDDEKVTGMITDRDICIAAYTQGKLLDDILVHSAMAKDVVSAGPDCTLDELEELMATRQIRRIPIVDRDGKPVGIVSMNDLAIEAVQPDTAMKQGPTKVTHTLAAICQPRAQKKQRRKAA